MLKKQPSCKQDSYEAILWFFIATSNCKEHGNYLEVDLLEQEQVGLESWTVRSSNLKAPTLPLSPSYLNVGTKLLQKAKYQLTSLKRLLLQYNN